MAFANSYSAYLFRDSIYLHIRSIINLFRLVSTGVENATNQQEPKRKIDIQQVPYK